MHRPTGKGKHGKMQNPKVPEAGVWTSYNQSTCHARSHDRTDQPIMRKQRPGGVRGGGLPQIDGRL